MNVLVPPPELAVNIVRFTGGYTRVPILRELNFQAFVGESVAVLGDNGTGKTTFFRSILQLLPQQNGSISILGRSVQTGRDKRWVRSQIGYVPQTHGTGKFPISAVEAVLLGRWGKSFGFGKRPSKQDYELTEHLLEQVGLAKQRNTDCRLLSGGQRQRLNIARALVRQPRILLLDEPTTYLDEGSRRILNGFIGELRAKERVTVITITHEREEALRMADRIVYLRQGQLQDEKELAL